MPICPFFVSGKCTYGSKCFNLHVDVGQAIQTTVKGSVAGKQWLLSCFAPFEGDTVLPDFIEDQCFEEVRSEYYAARATNSEHLAQQKFNQAWAQAQELSMRMITMDQNTVGYLVNTFGVNGKRKPQGTTTTSTPNNPPNPFGQTTTPASGGSIFGGSTPQQSNPFGQSQSTTPASSGGSIFGQAATTPSGGSIFGQAATAPPGGSIFGGSAPASNNNPFGQPVATTPATSGGSIFGGQQQLNSGNNIFGQSQQATAGNSIFGGSPAAAPSIFAQQNQQLMQAQQQQQQSPQTTAPGGSIFGQSVFGGGGMQQSQQSTGSNIFAQSQQPTTIQQGNVFQQQTAPTSIFAQAQQAIPAQPSPFQQPQPAQPPPNPFQNASPFGGAGAVAPQPAAGNVFGNLGQMANQAAQSAFMGQSGAPASSQSSSSGNAFGGGQQQQMGNDQVVAAVYSKMDELRQDQLAIYKSDAPFELGKVPHAPPPRELCF